MPDEPKLVVHVERAHKRAGIPDNSADTGRCPNCAGETETGFGLAGGGYGAYTFCPHCGIVVTKTEEQSMEAATEPPAVEVMPPARPWEALPDGTYAIVELMGHQTLVGRVEEIERFGTKLMAIEVLFNGALLPVVLQGGASVYRFTQCAPETAWKAQHKPDRAWSLPEPIRAIIPVALLPAPEPAPARSYRDETGDDLLDDDDDLEF